MTKMMMVVVMMMMMIIYCSQLLSKTLVLLIHVQGYWSGPSLMKESSLKSYYV